MKKKSTYKESKHAKAPEERPLTESAQNGVVLKENMDTWNSDTDNEMSDESIEEFDRKRKKPKNKYQTRCNNYVLYGFVVVIVIVAIIIAISLWWIHKSHSELCKTQSCKEASAYITGKMNFSADPCNDFYNYVCGTWLQKLHVPKSKAKYNIFSVISDENDANLKKIYEDTSNITLNGTDSSAVHKTKMLYELCMDEDTIEKLGITPVLELIKDIGSWTVTTNAKAGFEWKNESWDFFTTLIKINKYNHSPLFNFFIGTDDKNSTTTIPKFEQSGITLSEREAYFENHTDCKKLHDAFLEFAVEISKYLGNENSTDARQKMEEVYQLEKSLAKIYMPQEELLDPEKNYHKMTLQEFQDLFGNTINWVNFTSKLTGKTMQPSDSVIVYTPNYFKKLGDIISRTDKSIMANYFVWNMINRLTGYLPSRFVNASMILSKAESGVTKLSPRWRRCNGKAEAIFGFVASALYIQDRFSLSSREKVIQIAQAVRDAFIRNLPSVDWMDEKTRNTAIDKAKAMGFRIAFPDWIMVQQKLDDYYKNITIYDGEFFKTRLEIQKFYYRKNMLKLGKSPNPDEWSMKPVEVNAFYTPSYNYLAFMAGILQQPFYSPTFPKSFNFGTTGMIAGHEMTHGFDNTGRNYDKHGNLHNWWSDKSAENFKKNSQCMIDQYSRYTAEGEHLKGDRTLGENIADNGGVNFAYSAYKKWLKDNNKNDDVIDYEGLENFSGDQLFYIGFGQLWCTYYTPTYAKQAILTDEHSISKFRTIGVVSNSNDFARAFNCKRGSPMNPETKCKVW